MDTNSYSDELKTFPTGVTVKLSLYVFNEEGVFIAYCPSLDLNGSGYSIQEAISSFKETVGIYLSYGLTKNTLMKDLRAHGWNVRGAKQRKIKAPNFDSLLQNEEFIDILKNREYQKFDTPVEIPV